MSDLKSVKQIEPQEWMISSQTNAVMAALNDGAAEVMALFVGGCVRNVVLGEEVKDIDIATRWLPEEAAEKLQNVGAKVIPTGIEHGTVTAVFEDQTFEITTLRKDVETDGRHAVVAFSQDWAEDAQRRDFTMNTLLADQAGNIYDPTGRGLEDLEARCVVFVGDPGQRIAEDYLRILRFFRFHALYGQGDPDAESLKACRAAADKISGLSKERITQEFFKIMSVDRPVDVLEIMFENGVLSEFCFSEYRPELLKYFCEFQLRYGLGFLASRLLVLAGIKEENMQAMEKFLLIPKVFQKDMQAISQILALDDLSNDHAVRVAVYKYGRVPTAQALIIELVQDRVMNGYAPTALEIIQNWDIPNFPVSGEDLMKAGIKEGPALGQKLQEIEEWWIRQDFMPDHRSCLKELS